MRPSTYQQFVGVSPPDFLLLVLLLFLLLQPPLSRALSAEAILNCCNNPHCPFFFQVFHRLETARAGWGKDFSLKLLCEWWWLELDYGNHLPAFTFRLLVTKRIWCVCFTSAYLSPQCTYHEHKKVILAASQITWRSVAVGFHSLPSQQAVSCPLLRGRVNPAASSAAMFSRGGNFTLTDLTVGGQLGQTVQEETINKDLHLSCTGAPL